MAGQTTILLAWYGVCRKTPTKPMAALLPIETSRPTQLVCIDFLKVDVSKCGYEDILVITDHFTRFAKAIPCKKITAQATAKALYENFIVHFSFPEQLHSVILIAGSLSRSANWPP